MKGIVIALEALSIFMSLLVLYGSIFEVKSRSRKNKLFLYCVAINIFTIICDMLAWIFNDTSGHDPLLWCTNFLAFSLGYIMSIMFIRYIVCYLSEKIHISSMYYLIPRYVGAIAIVIILVLSVTGKLFVIENHQFILKELYWVSQIFPVLVMIYIFVLIIKFNKSIGIHDSIAMLMYIIMPVAAILLHVIWPHISFSYVATTCSLQIVYIMMQAEQERDFRAREKDLYEQSNTDMLTGLLNRRAYDSSCKMLIGNRQVGVIFCDINSLKYTNDNFGHEAGDELIKSFASILKNSFRNDETFRISGDEFVILLSTIDKNIFDNRFKLFKKAVLEANSYPIASIGESYGNGEKIIDLIALAENKMYVEKADFHQRYPQYSRNS